MKPMAIRIAAMIGGGFLCSCMGHQPGNHAVPNATRLTQIESMYEEYRKDFPDVKDISPAEVKELQRSGDVVLVDVREAEEQAVSMIPGAISATAFSAAEESYRDKTVITYCTIGARSGKFADELRRKGFNVLNLKGSLLAWTHAGLPLLDASGRKTKRVHVYGKKWDLAADGYEAVW